jgi:hypothetical protein
LVVSAAESTCRLELGGLRDSHHAELVCLWWWDPVHLAFFVVEVRFVEVTGSSYVGVQVCCDDFAPEAAMFAVEEELTFEAVQGAEFPSEASEVSGVVDPPGTGSGASDHPVDEQSVEGFADGSAVQSGVGGEVVDVGEVQAFESLIDEGSMGAKGAENGAKGVDFAPGEAAACCHGF